MQDNKILNDWLSRRKISKSVIKDFNIHWGTHNLFGECIVIPVFDEHGNFLFNKYRRNPLQGDIKPKYVYDKGGSVSLYGIHNVKDAPSVLITEGEMDCLVALSHNIVAVSSTGGAMSFKEEWRDYFNTKEVILCFDNDEAGGEGMVKVLSILPHAKVVFLPDRAGIKDISDYVTNGGDLNALIKTALSFPDMQSVVNNRSERQSTWQSTYFHDAYIKEHTKPLYAIPERKSSTSLDELQRAKSYPISSLIEFNRNKACCLFHKEDTPSLHYYPKTNTCYCFGQCGRVFDSIEIYRRLHNCSFNEALKALQ